MKGTNPDGTKYADPVTWVAYFRAGEAVHYFPRGSYGSLQSLGCVELPWTIGQVHLALPDLRHARDGHPGLTRAGSRAPRDTGAHRGAGLDSIGTAGCAGARPPPPSHQGATVPADKLRITLAGREHVVEAGTTAATALDGQDAIAARVNGSLRDLAVVAGRRRRRRAVAADSPDGLAILRHSAAHVMAQAVQELYPQARLGIGPPVENGFYYDFDVPAAVRPR